MADGQRGRGHDLAVGPLGRFLLGGTGWAAVGLAAAVVLAFVVNALAARLLSPAGLGAFLLVVSVAQAVSVWAEVGQPGLIAREIGGRLAEDRVAVARYLTRSLVLVAAATALVTVLAATLGAPAARAVFDDSEITAVFPLLGILVLARAAERTIGDAFRGLGDIRSATIFGTTWTQAAACALLGGLVAASSTATGRDAVLLYGLGGATAVPVGLLVLRRRLPRVALPRRGYRQHLTEGWPLIGHRALGMVLVQAPLWIVAAVAGAEDAAPFGLALRVVTAVAIPLTVVNQVVPPVVARLHHRGDLDRLERSVRVTATLAAAGAVVVVSVFVAAGEPLIALAFGEQYVAEATPLLIILSVGQLGAVWAGSCGIVLIQIGEQRLLMVITAVVTAIELVAATVAASTSGTTAVAVVAAAGVLLQNGWMSVAVRRRSGVRTDVSPALLVDEVRRRRRAGTEASSTGPGRGREDG